MDPIEMQAADVEPRAGRLERLAAIPALIGGVLVCFAALLVSVSVLGRWLFNKPIPADYELVEVAVGVAVFCFLSYTQARSGHIAVDTFTQRLPARLNAVIDGIWDLVFAGFLAFFAWGLYSGGMEARLNGMTLIQLPWPIWPVYLVCAVLAALACFVAICVGVLKIGGAR